MTLDDWLEWQQRQHSQQIDLGLDRVAAVADALSLRPFSPQSVVAAGTNGKGSTVALVAGLIGDRGTIGVFTSPHLWRYNERIAVNGLPVGDAEIVTAFEAVESARGEISLTFFEYSTLAALWIFARRAVDFAVLEIGLGGRLDAVNIIDADVALITPIGLDHCDWLGSDRGEIGYEKAGILRPKRPAFCSDRDMPATIADRARCLGTPLAVIGRDFDINRHDTAWCWHDHGRSIDIDPHPAVWADNLALAIAGVLALDLSVTSDDVARACRTQALLHGRREIIDAPIPIIYDVGHNAEAVALLIDVLLGQPVRGRTHVVIGMLADKPVETVARLLAPITDRFFPVGLDRYTARGLDGDTLARRLGVTVETYADPSTGLAAAEALAVAGDRIVVCGSFFTVAQARRPDNE
ncbi:MAG: bifunctional folylpolyglutamate synthase/dihydrofolate synthase [Salinisphaera sp.]|jgi:dihydrofolate synthase/folylpolyglutamate synthase|nr:bifunctional folylpolyglutamate synthase/dihydrofolate synthase [Salinisphaera sp.]